MNPYLQQILHDITKRLEALEQRTWVGLTDEEVNHLLEHTDWLEWPHLFAKAIEAKLKEKNG